MPNPDIRYGLTGGPDIHICNASGSQDKIVDLNNSGELRLAASVVSMVGGTETLTNKTLTTPTISATGFTNAQHAHAAANSGGQIPIANTTGTLAVGRGGTAATTASAARDNLGVDAAGTDNSTDVTLAGTPDYLTLSGQVITRGLIDLATDITGLLPIAKGGTAGATAVAALANLGGSVLLTAYKDADQDKTTDTTLADDSKLFLPLLANKTYPLIALILEEHAASPDFKWTITVPAGAKLRIFGINAIKNSTGTVNARFINTSGAAQAHVGSTAGPHAILLIGAVEMGGTAGNCAVQWSQNTSSATAATVKEGSMMISVEK